MEWALVWASLSDERLEETFYHYLWLAVKTPNSHADRIAQLKSEAQRRGRQDIIVRAQDLALQGASIRMIGPWQRLH